MEGQHKTYRCTVNGSDAVGFDGPDDCFTVVAGSVLATVTHPLDTLAMSYREIAAPEGSDCRRRFVLRGDAPYHDAAIAARVVCGCPSDEAAWIAADGSHPIVRRQSE